MNYYGLFISLHIHLERCTQLTLMILFVTEAQLSFPASDVGLIPWPLIGQILGGHKK